MVSLMSLFSFLSFLSLLPLLPLGPLDPTFHLQLHQISIPDTASPARSLSRTSNPSSPSHEHTTPVGQTEALSLPTFPFGEDPTPWACWRIPDPLPSTFVPLLASAESATLSLGSSELLLLLVASGAASQATAGRERTAAAARDLVPLAAPLVPAPHNPRSRGGASLLVLLVRIV